jgi:hypothetical protein
MKFMSFIFDIMVVVAVDAVVVDLNQEIDH